MTVIEIPDTQAAALKAKAAAPGLTLRAWLGKLAEESPAASPRKPLKTGRGMRAKYGPAPSAEEIDENRRQMFSGFGEARPAIAGVADTHAALWYLLKNPSLSIAARRFMDHAAAAGQDIVDFADQLGGDCLSGRKEPAARNSLRGFEERAG